MFLSHEQKDVFILVYVLHEKISRRNPGFLPNELNKSSCILSGRDQFLQQEKFFLPIYCIFVFYLVIFVPMNNSVG